MTWRALIAVLLLAVTPLAAQEHSRGLFHNCPPEGKRKSPRGFFDEELNALKNRDIPPRTVEDRKLTSVIAKKPASLGDMGRTARVRWSDQAREDASAWEEAGARIEGRLIAIRRSGPESCNCHKSKDIDIHLWIATRASREAKPTRSMVVEISPRTPKLVALYDQLLALARKGTRVRVTGWMLWDQEHGSEVGKSRGTIWEIHPVHKIEVFEDGHWKVLR